MATKKVTVKPEKAKANLQIIVDFDNPRGVPVFGPHKNADDRVSPANGTELEVVSKAIKGSGKDNSNLPEYYYITDNKSNGKYRRYFIKKDDAS